jgi:hypothetical protein
MSSRRRIGASLALLSPLISLLGVGGAGAAGRTDTRPPSTPTGLKAGSITQTGMSLTWKASRDNVGVAGYDIYVNGKLVGIAH